MIDARKIPRDTTLPQSVATAAKAYLNSNVMMAFSKQALVKNDSCYDSGAEQIEDKVTKKESEKTKKPKKGAKGGVPDATSDTCRLV